MWHSNKKVLTAVNSLYIQGVNKAVEDISKLKNG